MFSVRERYIAYQYDDVDNEIIVDIISTRLPIIKAISLSLLSSVDSKDK